MAEASIPADAKSCLRRGEELAARGEGEAASKFYRLAALHASRGGASLDRLDEMKALLFLGRFDEAFRAAEALLDRDPSPLVLENLVNQLSTASGAVSLEALERLQAWAAAHPESPWPVALRVDALHKLASPMDALRESEKLTGLPERYRWMRYARGWMLLSDLADYDGAERELAAVAAGKPTLWQARAHLAEIALCRGDAPAAFRLLDELAASLGGFDQAQAIAWRGELRLWIGEYERALEDLGGASGRAPFALGWRGAAKLLLGRPAEALADLDAYLADRSDWECTIWRGEALRALGRKDEARAAFDRALAGSNAEFWALMGRGLLRGEAGDLEGMRNDYLAMHPRVRLFLEAEAGLKEPAGDRSSAATLRRLFELGLKRGRGVRRPSPYVFPVWMGPSTR